MGINLWDIGAIATGAIERDREHTKENLAIRADELTAKRNSLIARKNKKYDTELALYVKEQEKVNKVKALNATTMHNDNPLQWATRYLTATDSDFVKLSDTMQVDVAGAFAQSNAGKKLSELAYPNVATDPDKLAAILAAEEDSIYKNTREQLINAKGDSFLIKKILGDSYKKSEVKDLEQLVNADDKVKKIIADTDKKEITDATTEDKTLGEYKYVKKIPKVWNDDFIAAKNKMAFNSTGTAKNFMTFMRTNDILGLSTEANYKLTEADSVISGQNDSARAFADTYKTIYNEVLNSLDGRTLYDSGVKRNQISNQVNETTINKAVQKIILERYYTQETGYYTQKGKARDFVGVVPLTIVDTNNLITLNGKTHTITNWESGDKDTSTIKDIYKEFINTESKKVEHLYKGDANPQFNSRNRIQLLLEAGDEKMLKAFDTYASKAFGLSSSITDPDKPIQSHSKVLADEELLIKMAKESGAIGDSVIKLDKEGKVIPQTEGKYGTDKTRITLDPNNNGFKQGGIFIPWEKVERLDQVKDLPNLLKLRYETWKSKQ